MIDEGLIHRKDSSHRSGGAIGSGSSHARSGGRAGGYSTFAYDGDGAEATAIRGVYNLETLRSVGVYDGLDTLYATALAVSLGNLRRLYIRIAAS